MPAVLISDVLREVAEAYGLTVSDLLAQDRTQPRAEVRQLAMALADEMTGCSLSAIGRAMRRDHSTVLHGVRHIRDQALRRTDLQIALSGLRARITDAATVRWGGG